MSEVIQYASISPGSAKKEDVGGLGGQELITSVHSWSARPQPPVIPPDLAVVFGDGAFQYLHFVSHSPYLPAPPRLLLRIWSFDLPGRILLAISGILSGDIIGVHDDCAPGY